MKPNIIIHCEQCYQKITTNYYLVGSIIDCPFCSYNTPVIIHKYIEGTGIEITFNNFVHLITYQPYREVIIPIINKWFKTKELNNEILFLNEDDIELDVIEIHKIIQNNKAYQSRIYNEAMTLWR